MLGRQRRCCGSAVLASGFWLRDPLLTHQMLRCRYVDFIIFNNRCVFYGFKGINSLLGFQIGPVLEVDFFVKSLMFRKKSVDLEKNIK